MKIAYLLNLKINEYFTESIFWICLVLSFIGMAIYSPIKPKAYGDNIFNVEAKIIANHIKGVDLERNIKFDHSVIPTLFYVIPALLSNQNYESSTYFVLTLTWNLLSFLLAIWLYIKAFKLTDNFSRLLLLLMLIIIPYFIYYHLTFSSEAISFLLIAAITFLVTKHQENNRLTNVIFIGLLFGILIANRPNFILFVPISIVAVLYFKMWQHIFIPVIAVLVFFLFTQIYKLGNAETNKDKSVFLLEQIHSGMFFMRSEFTDWSFFNNEYRERSIDYTEYMASKQNIYNSIDNATNPRDAYIEEIIAQIKLKPLASIIHPLKKFIHGNSIHVGSKLPGKLDRAYLNTNYKTFAINIFLNLLNWSVIVIGILFILQLFKENELMGILLISIIIAFNLFNMLSASEQRYLFPTKIIYIILTIKFVMRYFKINSFNHK
jgi:hypothetical protein